MTNMQKLVLVLAFIFSVLLGILLATTFLGGKPGAAVASRAPSASPAASAASSAAPATSAPSASAEASAEPAPSADASSSPPPANTATIVFSQLVLDATTNASGRARSITFTAQAGTVTVKLATESGGNTAACLFAGSKQLGCRTATSGTLSGKSTKATTTYTVTLRGAASATPKVTVTIAFPASKPKVVIKDARFDSTANADTNGLQVVTTPRAGGYVHVTASWTGSAVPFGIDLIEQGGPGVKQVASTADAKTANQGFRVAPPNAWMVVLKRTDDGGRAWATATYTWP